MSVQVIVSTAAAKYGIGASTFEELVDKISKTTNLEKDKFELKVGDCYLTSTEVLLALNNCQYGSKLQVSVTEVFAKDQLRDFSRKVQPEQLIQDSIIIKKEESQEVIESVNEGVDDKDCAEVYRLWSIATPTSSRLSQTFFNLIVLDFQRFQLSRAFYNASTEFISALFDVDDVAFVKSEVEFLEILAKWHKHHPSVEIAPLLSKLRLHTITAEELVNRVEPLNILPSETLYLLLHSLAHTPYVNKSFPENIKPYTLRKMFIPIYESIITDFFKNSTKWQYSSNLSINAVLQSAKYVPYTLKSQPVASLPVSISSLIKPTASNSDGVAVHSSATGELCYIEAEFPYHVVINRIILGAYSTSSVDSRLEYITIEAANGDGSSFVPIHKIEAGTYPPMGPAVFDFSNKKIIANKVRLTSYIAVGTGVLIFE